VTSPRRARTVYELLRDQLGSDFRLTQNQETSTVGTTAVVITKNNPNRLALVVVNLSTNTVYLRPQGTPSSSVGIVLTPGGGLLALSLIEDYILQTLEWSAVASGADSDLLILELIGVG